VDTNVIVYAYDETAGPKRERARLLLSGLWESGGGVISVQVLLELFVTLTRKLRPSLPQSEAEAILEDLSLWKVVEPTKGDVLTATRVASRWGISLWDAMILVAAQDAGARVLWSEDLQHGQDYDGVSVRNPFHPEPS